VIGTYVRTPLSFLFVQVKTLGSITSADHTAATVKQ